MLEGFLSWAESAVQSTKAEQTAIMSQTPQISILTPCFNTGKLVLDLADSLAKQTFKNFEWCISDDGSNEDTRQILETLESRYDFPIKVQYFEKQGGNYCRNEAFKTSTSSFVKFVDADDLLEHDLLEKQLAVASINFDGLVLSPTKVLKTDKTFFVVPLDPKLKSEPLKSYLKKATFMHGGCLLKRDLVSRVGGWDENLSAGQDLDFFRRVLLKDPPVQFAESSFIYRQHSDAPRISNLAEKNVTKFASHLQGLDRFVALLQTKHKLDEYACEMAQNYDLWGMKALGLKLDIGRTFIKRARLLSPENYRSGSRYSRILRPIFGDRFVGRLMRSSVWKKIHDTLTQLNLWKAS